MLKPDKIIRSKRKTLSLQITEYGELIVRVPRFISDRDILQFINKHKKWIEEKSKEIQIKRSKLKTYSFTEDEELLLLGNKLKLKFVQSDYPKKLNLTTVSVVNDSILVNTQDRAKIPRLLEKFYRTQSKQVIEQRVNYYLKKLNDICGLSLKYQRIKLTNGRKNIGSCSPTGNLNFSWRIVLAPIEVIDYIVVHELVHLKYKHHKKSFWLLVNRLKPDYRSNIVWIKENWFYLRDFLRK